MSEIQKGAFVILGLDADNNKKAVLVDETGSIISALRGVTDQGQLRTILVDDTGSLQAIMKGMYDDQVRAIAVDSNGRMLADHNLVNTAATEFDQFLPGCNVRFNCGAVGYEQFLYSMRTHPGRTYIRYMDIRGTASLGSYNITLGNGDAITGGVAVNGVITDYRIYKKTIPVGAFDTSFTNCTLTGMIAEVEFNEQLLLTNKAYLVGGSQICRNGNLSDSFAIPYAGEVPGVENEFISLVLHQPRDLYYVAFKYGQSASTNASYKFRLWVYSETTSAWIEAWTTTLSGTSTHMVYLPLEIPNISKLKFTVTKTDASGYVGTKYLYDIAAIGFPVGSIPEYPIVGGW